MDQRLPAVPQAESLASGEPRLKPHGLRKAGEAGVQRCKDPRPRPPEGASEALLGPDLQRRVAKAIQALIVMMYGTSLLSIFVI